MYLRECSWLVQLARRLKNGLLEAVRRLLIGLRPVPHVLLTRVFGFAQLVFVLVWEVGLDVCSEFRRRFLPFFLCSQQSVVLTDALV